MMEGALAGEVLVAGALLRLGRAVDQESLGAFDLNRVPDTFAVQGRRTKSLAGLRPLRQPRPPLAALH